MEANTSDRITKEPETWRKPCIRGLWMSVLDVLGNTLRQGPLLKSSRLDENCSAQTRAGKCGFPKSLCRSNSGIMYLEGFLWLPGSRILVLGWGNP